MCQPTEFWQPVYGLIIAVVTGFVAWFLVLLEVYGAPIDAKLRRVLLLVVLLAWGSATAWLTFSVPFSTTGNGYFGLWLGVAFVSRLLFSFEESGHDSVVDHERYFGFWAQFVAAITLIVAVWGREAEAERPGTVFVLSDEEWGYSWSVGIVAAVLSFMGVLLASNPSGTKPLCKCGSTEFDLTRVMATLLFFWWGIAAGVLTMGHDAIFYYTGNGFFAAWAGVVGALFSMGLTVAKSKEAASSGLAPFAVLAICCLILISVLPQLFGLHEREGVVARVVSTIGARKQTPQEENYDAQIIYALVIAAPTLVEMLITVIVFKKAAEPGPLGKGLAVVRFILWGILASWLSFTGPFVRTSVGYFATWLGFMCTVAIVRQQFFAPPPATPEINVEGKEDVGQVTADDDFDHAVIVSAGEPVSPPPVVVAEAVPLE